MNCPFCTLFETPIDDREVIGDNDAAVAWLHESRAHRGHVVVAARRHVENLSNLGETEADRFFALARRVERAVLVETEADRAILMKLGLQVPHLHLHVYPFSREASREDVMKVIDGMRTDQSSSDDHAEFAERLRERVATGGDL